MRIQAKYVSMALAGIVPALICVVVQFCGNRLGVPFWLSSISGIVLGVLGGRTISEPLFDLYMTWHLRCVAAARRREPEDESY